MPALKAWVCACTGVEQCVQENEPRPFVRSVYARIQAMNVKAYGFDDVRNIEETSIVSGELVTRTYTRVCGQRTFTLRVFIESASQDGVGLADNQLERMRMASVLPSNRATLSAVNVAAVSVGDSQMADIVTDDRSFSAWFADVDMNVGVSYVNRAQEAGTIGSVELYNAVRDGEPERTAVP